jgi:hypothetical protein
MNTRVDAFAGLKELPAFETKPRREKPVPREAIERIAHDNNFPSRQPARAPGVPRRKPRVHRTGRNQHLGVKATAETVERFYKAADARAIPLGELLRLALDALERAGGAAPGKAILLRDA